LTAVRGGSPAFKGKNSWRLAIRGIGGIILSVLREEGKLLLHVVLDQEEGPWRHRRGRKARIFQQSGRLKSCSRKAGGKSAFTGVRVLFSSLMAAGRGRAS